MATEAAVNVIFGVPDDARATVSRIGQSGLPTLIFPGTASFLIQLVQMPANRIWVGPGADPTITIKPGPLFNIMADPDIYGQALGRAVEIADRAKRRCLNHPRAVLETTRDQVSEKLQGIAGLDVPRVVRLRPKRPGDIAAAAAERGLTFPVLVRVIGHHDSETLVKLDSPQDEEPLHAIPWGGNELYVTEFRDYRGADGLYRKFRFAVIDGAAYIRHVFPGEGWLLNFDTRAFGDVLMEEESARLRNFPQDLAPLIRDRIAEIHARLGLDYFGVDCAIGEDGSMTLFEANACMNLMNNPRPSPNIWDGPIADIRAALLRLIGLMEQAAVAPAQAPLVIR